MIAGPPNAGKSSLFNALLGRERAIVTEIPGTTRDAIEAQAVIEGFPFRLVDTAGLRDSDDRVERLGIEVSRRYLGAADLVLFCEEGTRRRDRGRAAREEFLPQLRRPRWCTCAPKSDLSAPAARPPIRPSVGVSVVTGEGLAELGRRLAEVAFGGLVALGDVEPVVTRERHRAGAGAGAAGARRLLGRPRAAAWTRRRRRPICAPRWGRWTT